MAKNQNTYEKLRREMEKKRKANEKREQKRIKKELAVQRKLAVDEQPPAANDADEDLD